MFEQSIVILLVVDVDVIFGIMTVSYLTVTAAFSARILNAIKFTVVAFIAHSEFAPFLFSTIIIPKKYKKIKVGCEEFRFEENTIGDGAIQKMN